MAGGLKALEHLFPGFGHELEQAGAVPICPTFDMRFEIAGLDPWPRVKSNRQTYAMSRPLMERTLRRQVERLQNVRVQDGCRAIDIIGNPNTGAGTGIRYRTSGGNVETRPSDLIIDASGNGSLTMEFLKATGRTPPEETSIGVNMRYASALFGDVDLKDNYKIAYTLPNAPEESRGGLIAPAENNSYQLVLIGRLNDIPPISDDWVLSYARDLWTPGAPTNRCRMRIKRTCGRGQINEEERCAVLVPSFLLVATSPRSKLLQVPPQRPSPSVALYLR